MSTLRVEIDKGDGWELRAEGYITTATSVDEIAADIRSYAIQHPHRAFLNGVLVAGYDPLKRRAIGQRRRATRTDP